VTKRADTLELAVLGILADSPMHGYELRKRLSLVLGSLRAFSYGSLYPCLKALLAKGWICEDGPAHAGAPALTGKRAKIVYKLTAEGKERLHDMLGQSGPDSWEDEGFGVHFAFFRHTDAAVRLRILEGRRSRLEERQEGVRSTLSRARERLDSYTLELQKHGLESVDREVRWLNELIASERQHTSSTPAPSMSTDQAAAQPATTDPSASQHS
jgi:DNA-binding PadR family transcriptional regulator